MCFKNNYFDAIGILYDKTLGKMKFINIFATGKNSLTKLHSENSKKRP